MQDAIKAIQFKLKNIKLSKNGIVIYSGTIDDKLITIDIEPIVPILSKKYLCSNRFLIEPLEESLNIFDETFGFIIISGNETKLFTLKGKHIKKIYEENVSLTNSTRRGGSSAGRISRSIEENHMNYIKIINDKIYKLLVKENKLLVKGIVVAGPADMKNKYMNICDTIIKSNIIKVITTDNNDLTLNRILDLSSDILGDQKIIKEKSIINEFMENLRLNNNKIIYTKNETLDLFNDGVIEKLIIYENNDNIDYYIENKTNVSEIYIISDSSVEGNNFVKNFGGIGGILRYPIIKYEDYEDYEDFF